MCCGQVARQLSDAEAVELYNRYQAGDLKWHLCAEYRIGTPEFERAYERGNQLTSWPNVGYFRRIGITQGEAL